MITLQDLDCPVCLQMIIQPILLPECHHLFCNTCIQSLLDLYYGKFQCPLCRKKHIIYPKPQVDQQIMKYIKSAYPRDYDKRQQEQNSINRQLYGDDYHLEIYYGYKKKFVSNDQFIWITFVEIENSYHTFKTMPVPNQIIKRVQFFFDFFDCRFSKREPFSQKILSTDKDQVIVTIEFQTIFKLQYDLENLQLQVPITFKKGGQWFQYKLVLKKRLLQHKTILNF